MPPAPRYEDDFFAWSQHQAELLRALRDRGLSLPEDLDLDHVVQEIEELGLSELNSVLGHLEGALIQLAKAASWPGAPSLRKWLAEAEEHQGHAACRWTPAMRQKIALDRLWRQALAQARAELLRYGRTMASLPLACPLGFDDLLSEEPDAGAQLARLRGEGS